MLKFFRKYNRIILVVGVVVLMASFGIGPAIRSLRPGPSEQAVGTVNGAEIIAQQQSRASAELRLVQQLVWSGIASQMQQPTDGGRRQRMMQRMVQMQLRQMRGVLVPFRIRADDDRNRSLAWLLAKRDARAMGIDVSRAEVSRALAMLGFSQNIEQIAERLETTEETIRTALRHWLLLEQYAAIVSGDAFTGVGSGSAQPGLHKLNLLTEVASASGRQAMTRARQAMAVLRPSQRVSEPLVKHYIQQDAASVGGRLLTLNAADRLDKVDPPSEQRLQALFDKYKDDLPGTGEPWAIGYKYHDRVKLEALVLPMQRVRQSITVEGVEIIDYYENNKAQFRKEPATQPATTQAATQPNEPQYKPIGEVSDQIEQTLTEQKAKEKAKLVLETAISLMEQPLRSVPDEGGYKDLPNDFSRFISGLSDDKAKSLRLEAVVAEIEKRYGIKPKIVRFTKKWHPVPEISSLSDIGQAQLASERGDSLQAYIQTARTFDPSTSNVLTALRLQVGVPSARLQTDDSRLVFRLTAAEASHPPASLDAVREKVAADAREIAAYQSLERERSLMLEQARSQGLDNIAESVAGQVEQFEPVPRRESGRFRQGARPPELPQVGRSEKLIDAIFDLAARLHTADTPLSDKPLKQRIASLGLKAKRQLVFYQVDQFEAVTDRTYQQRWERPNLAPQASQWAQGETSLTDPLSFAAIKRRTGFKPANAAGDESAADESTADGNAPSTSDSTG